MHACPHCGKPGISGLRKSFLGPASTATCSACGAKVGVPWGISMAVMSPMLLVPILGVTFELSRPALIALAVAIFAPMTWAYVRFVPLIRR